MLYYVYILYSESADKYYVGHTSNPQKRLSEHNSYENKSKFTAKYQPWCMMAYFPVSEIRGEAMKVESFIKKQKSKVFIQKVISQSQDTDFIKQIVEKVVG